MVIRKRGSVWYFDGYLDGERVVKSLGTSDKAEAKAAAERLKMEAWKSKHLGEAPDITFAQAAESWLELKRLEGMRDILNSELRIEWFNKLLGHRLVKEINATDVDLIISTKSKDKAPNGKPVRPATINRYLAAFGAVLNFCRDKGWLLRPPPKIRKFVEIKEEIRFATKDQAKALIAALPKHLQYITRFAFATGMRRQNITHLKWSQIDWDRNRLIVAAKDFKQGRAHAIPLNEDAMKILLEVRTDEDHYDKEYVFVWRGKPQTKVVGPSWDKAVKAAGLPEGFRMHDCRATWTVWHLQAGTPIDVVQKLGGWANLAVLQKHYAAHSASHLETFAGRVSL